MDLFSSNPDLEADRPAALKDKALLVHERLCQEYECPIDYFSTKDPLSELVSALLSHRTKNKDSKRAYDTLRERFPTWEEVRDADVLEVEKAIATCTWPEQKAPRLQAVLEAISNAPETDGLSLEELAGWPASRARPWLQKIKGVGPKTSAAVLLFSRLRVPALPVDSHHHRVAQRLGLIPESMAVGPSHDALAALVPSGWDAQTVYDHHEVFMLHGQKCCSWRRPTCGRCPVYDLCVWGEKAEREQ
ncbi:endonuclease III domain-containing protein [Rubrivirga sp.]|uniref:endonuclease III domain-containing protein n=1 Tax=Rubrivirga sp. TaxID=1885344 RepID=UPI003C766B36